MSNPQDIIGKTSEMMDWHQEIDPEQSPDEYGKWNGYAADCFPEVAQALLIAVEALADSERHCEMSCKGYDKQSGEPLCAGCPSRIALARIRSLTSK